MTHDAQTKNWNTKIIVMLFVPLKGYARSALCTDDELINFRKFCDQKISFDGDPNTRDRANEINFPLMKRTAYGNCVVENNFLQLNKNIID